MHTVSGHGRSAALCFGSLVGLAAADLTFSGTPSVSYAGLGNAAYTIGSITNHGAAGAVRLQVWGCTAPWISGALNGQLLAQKDFGTLAANASASATILQTPFPVPEGVYYLTVLALKDGAVDSSLNYASASARLSDRWDQVQVISGVIGTLYNSGGYGVTIYNLNQPTLPPGTTSLGVSFTYQMYSIPDRADVFFGNRRVFTTGGYVSNGSTVNLEDWQADSGPITVRMDGSSPGTAWEFRLTTSATSAAGITSPLSISAVMGQPFTYHITANRPVSGYSASGLPAWLSFNSQTGTLSGTPTVSSTATITVGATLTAGGSINATVAITATTVLAPVVANPQIVTGWLGVPLSGLSIQATNLPTAYNATVAAIGTPSSWALPSGTAIDRTAGAITGTPVQTGLFHIATAAANSAGIGTGELDLSVYGAPRLSGVPTDSSVRVGHPVSATVSVLDAPATSGPTVTGLPDGLAFTNNAIAGTPTTIGDSVITVQAANPAGAATATWTLHVVPVPVPTVGGFTGGGAISNGVWNTNATNVTLVGTAVVETAAQLVWLLDNQPPNPALIAADGSWTLPLSGLGEGTHTISIAFRDALGVTSVPAITTLLIDRTAPPIPVTDTELGQPIRTLSALIGHAEEPFSIVLVLDNTGAEWGRSTVAADGTWQVATTTNLKEGAQVFHLAAEDAAGNRSADSQPLTVTIDRTPPVATLAWDGNPDATTTPLTLIITTSENVADLNAAQFQADNATITNLSSAGTNRWTATVTPAQFGAVRVRLAAVHDLAGNLSAPAVLLHVSPGDLSGFLVTDVAVHATASGMGGFSLQADGANITDAPDGGWIVTLPLTATSPATTSVQIIVHDGLGRAASTTVSATAITPISQ